MRNDDWQNLTPEQAVSRLVAAHGGQLFGLGVRLCGDREEAEDLVQETFLRAFRKWDQFEGRSSPKTWLYTIASRVCQRMHRKRAGEPERMASLEELLPFAETSMPVVRPEDGGLAVEVRREARRQLEDVISTLPVPFRLPLVLKEIVGFSLAETAAILGLKPATVKTRLHRARLKLRQGLEAALPKEEAPPPAYSKQVCLDLLRAKQDALDRGVRMPQDVVCARCAAVFASMDLAQDLCQELGEGRLPPGVEKALLSQIRG